MKRITTLIIAFFIGLNLGFSQKDTMSITKDTAMTEIQKNKEMNGISEIRIKEPVLIKNADSEKKSFWDSFMKVGVIIGLLGGLLGLIVTGFAINDRWFKDAKVHSKIISFASNDGDFEIMKIRKSNTPEMKYGVKYFLKLSLNVTNKDLNYGDIDVLVKYAKIDRIFKGEIYSPRNYSDWKIGTTQYRLVLPQDKLLYYKTALVMNTTHLEYLTFVIFDEEGQIKSNLQGDDLIPESIQIVFKSSEQRLFRKENNKVETNEMTMNSGVEKYIWEDEKWKRL
jgi:hypothetical protein